MKEQGFVIAIYLPENKTNYVGHKGLTTNLDEAIYYFDLKDAEEFRELGMKTLSAIPGVKSQILMVKAPDNQLQQSLKDLGKSTIEIIKNKIGGNK